MNADAGDLLRPKPAGGLHANQSISEAYNRLVKTGKLARDPEQVRIAARLDQLIVDLSEKRLQSKSSALGWLFAKGKPKREPVRGLYLHGGVGRGKTMLMDMFFDAVPVKRKRRVHFNDFMADIHDRIARHRAGLKAGSIKGDDPIAPVAASVAAESWLICFDEFTVTDIADAMILSRLFTALFEHGVVLVATSNVAPDDLYRDGLNRSLFTPFLATLKAHSDSLSVDIDTDYRLRQLDRLTVYVTPLGPQADAALDAAWEAVREGKPELTAGIEVKGRTISVTRSAGRSARFSFDELCARPLGARDYLAIAARYDRIVLDHVPVMAQENRNEAKRFIALIDTFYDQNIRLILSAAAGPTELYTGKSGAERFEFDRTASRLIEMQSAQWIAASRDHKAANA